MQSFPCFALFFAISFRCHHRIFDVTDRTPEALSPAYRSQDKIHMVFTSVIIITAVISIAWYLTDKGEHFALYKLNKTVTNSNQFTKSTLTCIPQHQQPSTCTLHTNTHPNTCNPLYQNPPTHLYPSTPTPTQTPLPLHTNTHSNTSTPPHPLKHLYPSTPTPTQPHTCTPPHQHPPRPAPPHKPTWTTTPTPTHTGNQAYTSGGGGLASLALLCTHVHWHALTLLFCL